MNDRTSLSGQVLLLMLCAGMVTVFGQAWAADAKGALAGLSMERLDGVSLRMGREQTRALLGAPHVVEALEPELTAEVYVPTDNPSLHSATLLFDKQAQLVGKALVVRGDAMDLLVGELIRANFTLIAQSTQRTRLSGQDDDSDQALDLTILRAGDDTLLMVFPAK